MATKKAANYTPEMEKKMTEMYVAFEGSNADANKVIASAIGKTPASVRAKLANLGVYKTEEKAATTSTRVKKADLVAAIVTAGVPLNEAEAEGLEKATAGSLAKIVARLTNG